MANVSDVRLPDRYADLSGFARQAGEAVLLTGDDFFRAVLDALPAAIYTTDACGKITYYNEAAAELWGHRPALGESKWCGSWKLFRPDGRPLPHDECPMAVSLKENRPVTGIEAIAERPDGTRVAFMPYPTPLYDRSGTLIGAVNMLVDISDRKGNEESKQRLASIVESSDDAILSKDLDGVIMSWNRGAERLFGYTAEEVVGKPVTILIPEDRIDEEPAILERIRRGEPIDHYETIRRRKDGSRIDISLCVSPIRNAVGRIIGASKIARDITDRKRAQERQNFLLSEMKHRIKNTLATVQAIATQTLRSASRGERAAFIGRLQTLGSAHDLLSLESWDRAQVRDVVRQALAAFQESHRERFVIDGPEGLWLDANKSLLLAMGLHELATNAAKYGALSNGSGRVRVTWELLAGSEPGRIALRWEESGGPAVKAPEHKGFGSLLIERALDGGLGAAHLAFHPQGLSCRLEIAL
ncbi:MAG: PAS domain S-box protein [Methylobacteriaceae bacterium]|nr:PAS domain S-box protein [Methylobacteriaceae bacterium]MBV9243189.1 PAS domain S-box protein [Methylobacteriaceae bacterium]